MNYRAHVEGFTGHFSTLDELKVWANDLTRRFSLKGCTVKIWKAKGITGQCATYSSTPDREIVIGA
jgi:hypothetical protein